MALSTQPYKGTRDFYPDEMRFRRWMFGRLRDAVQSYGYEEYDGPMLEPFDLYAAKSGEELVNQQLYWMIDRGERKLAVRPEMTPTMARMVAGKIHELPKPVRWFSIPNLWRYERPQRGRLREHWQLNVDLLGGDPILADAEILRVALSVMEAFESGASAAPTHSGGSRISIRVNNRRLMDHLFREKLALDADKALAITKAIDARGKIGEEAYQKWLGDLGVTSAIAGEMEKFFKASFEETESAMPCQGTQELRALFDLLKNSGVRVGSASDPKSQVCFDPLILRGLDYYTGTVFEVYDTSPENRRAMFGGGRYDNLVGLFGNHKLSGVGFGMGDVTLQNFIETHGLAPKLASGIDVFVTLPKLELKALSDELASSIRKAGLRTVSALSVEGFGAQLKAAAKANARFVVLLGDQEIAEKKAAVKKLETGEQKTFTFQELPGAIAHWAGAAAPGAK